jgi:hypothetical protein
MRRSIFSLLLGIVGAAFPLTIDAQQSVAPVLVDRTMAPRDQSEVEITLRNPSDRVLRIYPTVNTVSVDDAGTIKEFQSRVEANNRNTVTSWLAISRGRIELQPNATRTIPLRIDVHHQAMPGTYHAFVGFPQGSNRPDAEQDVVAGNAPGSLVRIEVERDLTSYLKLGTFSTSRFLTDPQDGTFRFSLENPSDTPLRPSGEVIIYNGQGKEVASLPLQIKDNLAPGETKEYTMPMPATLEKDFGRHKAMLSVRYGNGQTALLQDTVFFYQLPLYQLLLLFGMTLVIALGIAYWVHRRYAVDSDGHHIDLFHRPDTVRARQEHDLDLNPYETDNS